MPFGIGGPSGRPAPTFSIERFPKIVGDGVLDVPPTPPGREIRKTAFFGGRPRVAPTIVFWKKPSGAGAPQTLPPGVVLRAANPKSNDCRGQSHHNSQLSEKRSQRTVFLTEEECGQKPGIREMLGLSICLDKIQPYFRSISCTNFQVTARIPTLAKSRLRRLLAARACGRSLPTRFFRTSFGRATLPPGEGISLRRNFLTN